MTSCDVSNGILSARVSVNGALTTEGHTFEWFESSQLLNQVFVGSSAVGFVSDIVYGTCSE